MTFLSTFNGWDGTPTFVVLWASMQTVQYGCFNQAHFFLAYKYQGIAKRVPLALDGKQEEPPSTCEKVTYWSLFAANITFVVLRGTFLIVVFLNLRGVSNFVVTVKVIATTCMGICAIISGVMLVAGVIKIRKFFKEKEAEDSINLPMLIRHAVAFGLYLVSSCIWLTALTITSYVEKAWADEFFYKASTCDFVAQAVA